MKNTGGKTVHQDGEGGERGGEGLKTTKLFVVNFLLCSCDQKYQNTAFVLCRECGSV